MEKFTNRHNKKIKYKEHKTETIIRITRKISNLTREKRKRMHCIEKGE